MTSTNLNIILTNALCCISAQAAKVSKLYSIGDKCVESEVQKLKLMNDWFNILKCYKIDPITSKFVVKIDYANYIAPSSILRTYNIVVNGVSSSSIQGDGVTLNSDILNQLLLELLPTSTFEVVIEPASKHVRSVYFYLDTPCDTISIIGEIRRASNGELLRTSSYTNYQTGYCTPINCLTEEEFNKVVANLMSTCDICECQLNQ